MALALAGTVIAGCSGGGADSPADRVPAVEASWHEIDLPSPPGRAGRIAVRDAATCAGSWYVVGAVIGSDGESRPAAWTSVDAQRWRPMVLEPREYWARRAILKSVGCRGEQVAAVGSKSGGAHGNPRTTSWYQRPDGTLVDVPADFELFGGPAAVSVSRIAAGPSTWLIAGNRSSGAAIWISEDATDFRLRDDDPALSSDDELMTGAVDVVHDGRSWTVVGRAAEADTSRWIPMAWTSPDGARWERQNVPDAGPFSDLQRVVRSDRGLLAVGIRDDRFGTWHRTGGVWQAGESFSPVPADIQGPRYVSGLALAADHALATVSDGKRFRLWAQTDEGWREVRTPTRPTVTGDAQMTVAADDGTVLLLTDDGTAGRGWVTTWDTNH